jgi:hypothetical protein
MADGGTLGFGLRHVYPVQDSLKHVYNVLKGSDAVVYQSMRSLGFEPVLYVYYSEDEDNDAHQGAMVDRVIDFDNVYEETVLDIVQEQGGIPVRQDGREMNEYSDFKDAEPVEWVTPLTTYNRQEGAFASYGNEPTLSWAYGDVCMIVRIGKAGDRMAYPINAQVDRVYKQRWNERRRY